MNTKQLTTIPFRLNEEKPNFEPEIKKRWPKVLIASIILTLLLAIAIRVPYLAYADSYTLDFLFGNTKYIVYIYFILFLCAIIFYSKKFFLGLTRKSFIYGYIFLIISLATILAAVDHGVGINNGISAHEGFLDINSNYISNIWKPNAAKSSSIFEGYYHFSEGMLGTFIISVFRSLYWIMALLLSVLFVLVAIALLFNKPKNTLINNIKNKFIKSLGGLSKNKKTNDELKIEKDDIEVKKVKDYEIRKVVAKDTPPISFLEDTSVINESSSVSHVKLMQDKLQAFFKGNGINVKFQQPIAMPLYKQISFKTNSTSESDTIIKSQRDMCLAMGIKECNINFKENMISIEIPAVEKNKISIKKAALDVKNIYSNNLAIAGILQDGSTLTLDLQKNFTSLIVGMAGSGANMLLSSLICSYAYFNSPDDNEMIIFSLDNSALVNFGSLQHLLFPVMLGEEKINEKLDKINDIISKRSETKDKNAKKLIVVISSVDKLLSNIQYASILENICAKAKSANASIILTSETVSNDLINSNIYRGINTKMALKVETEYESLLLFDNYKGTQLFGQGDGYFMEKNNKERFQSCYINQAEIIVIIDIISKFYRAKEDLKIEEDNGKQ